MSLYEQQWDRHVHEFYTKRQEQGDLKWPGDEWGFPERWERLFDEFFVPLDVSSWRNVVEIGAGTGKYTEKVLEASASCKVIDFDVSSEFLRLCEERLSRFATAGRLELAHIEGKRSDEMLIAIADRGLVRGLDAFFSIDAMVHVDLQYLAAYFVTAAVTLKPGAPMIMTLADATSESGFRYLIDGIPRLYDKQGLPTAKFEYLSPDMVRTLLARLGFTIDRLEHWENGRDVTVVARLTDVDVADAYRAALTPKA